MKHYQRKHQKETESPKEPKAKPVTKKRRLSQALEPTQIKDKTPTETPTTNAATTSIQPIDANSTQLDHNPFSVDELVSSDELITWLFGGIDSHLHTSPTDLISPPESLENFPDLEEFEYPIPSSHLKHPGELSHFPFSDQQVLVDEEVMESIEDALPSIKFQQDFKKHNLQKYLENYWKFLHPQFPILNMPSFSTKKSHPVLLLSMLTLGAYVSWTLNQTSNQSMIFFESIAIPLRWTIYKSKEFKPPPKVWIVQSLVLLQIYEICCSSRDLHERANLHRGLSIQMLKRSPMFGGNPLSKYSSTSPDVSPYASTSQWEKWIQEESMKRCALTTFYLETLHAVVFGHDVIIDLHDVKPTLPCDEQFWRSAKYVEGCLEPPLTLLASIKSILHKKSVKTRGFGQKIILSGLIALSFEVNDRQFEFSISELKSIKQLWQRKISEAFQFWDLKCSVSNVQSEWYNTYSLPFRELYESYTQLKHYDFMVYAGAPGRMNVEFNEKEVEVVSSRVKDWANSSHGRRSIVFIYYYLFNLLFHNNSPIRYYPKNDRCIYRKQMISHMLIILWCYNFNTCGPEMSVEQKYPVGFSWPHKENGHDYLERIKSELELLTGSPLTNVYKDIDIFSNNLDSISDKGNMVGLLRLFQEEYAHDSSEIAREHSRLLQNCIDRSLGSKNVFCNMFE